MSGTPTTFRGENADERPQFTASMWTPEEARKIVGIAKEAVPDLKTFSLPQGLQVQQGPDAVVEYIKEHLPALLDS